MQIPSATQPPRPPATPQQGAQAAPRQAPAGCIPPICNPAPAAYSFLAGTGRTLPELRDRVSHLEQLHCKMLAEKLDLRKQLTQAQHDQRVAAHLVHYLQAERTKLELALAMQNTRS